MIRLVALFLLSSTAGSVKTSLAPANWSAAVPLSSTQDAVDDLKRWTKHWKRGGDPPSVSEARELDEVIAELTRLVARDPKRGRAANQALLDLIRVAEGMALVQGFGPRALASDPLERARAALRANLKGPHSRETADFLAEVLQEKKSQPSQNRQAAAQALGEVRPPGALFALTSVARDEDAFVAQAAQEALVGWDDPRVHLLFLDLLERREGTRAAAEHLQTIGEKLGPQALERLRDIIGRLYLSDDWRDASRAQALVGSLDTIRAAPILIEALAAWDRRTDAGQGSRRIVEEIVVELRRISGRNLGKKPAPWHRWWGDVLKGKVLLPEAALARGEPLTSATFFGLRLASDRVLFLVDRSGSMEEDFGTGGETRYEEAIDQLFLFLKSSGPSTRFGLALFNGETTLWRSGNLIEATQAAQKQARRWLNGKRPKGGTQLHRGLLRALGADQTGRISPTRLEADTLVVLCDGATKEGSAWVADWIRRSGEDLQLMIHGVQIGAFGDGTLEALANGTGGQFVRVYR